ncbi:hypothetical protein FRB94_013799 [Tulasnella sp. JGI-2019a]|nr:hypothetical protein FRB94_013799 [Tulasnella sp. JGI-2019a]
MDGKECSVDASLSVIENPRAPKPKNISPSALPSAPIPPAPVSRGCSRPPDFEKSFSAAKPQTAPIIATTSADSTFDKPASTYVDLIKWAISRSPDNRATVVDICKQVAQQYPYYNDNTRFATLKSGVRQHLSQKPYFKFIVDQEGKRRGWTCDDLLTNKDIDGEAAHKGEHLVQGTDESELAATLASVDIDEAKGGPSSETKLKTSSGHPMIPAPNPSPPAKEAKPAVSTGTPGVFFFPPTTLYPQETRQRVRAHYVEIPRCFPWPSSFVDATLQSHQLLVQLVVRLYDEQDGPEMLDPSIHAKLSSSIGATGPGSSFMGSSVTNRNNAESSSTGDWSVVHDDDMFDMDGTEKGGGDSDGDSTEED